MSKVSSEIDVGCSNLHFFHKEGSKNLHVLDNISFCVPRGSTLAVVGPSGSGKTTLMRILLGLESPEGGAVYLNKERMAGGIGYVPQDAVLLPWRTAIQNAALGIEMAGELTPAHLDGLEGEFRRYDLAGFETAMWPSLSGGMKQKVALISAMAVSPSLLFCDEPFSAIDYVARLKLLNSFKSDCRTLGTTIVIVTHNLEEAVFLADRVLVLSPRPARIRGRFDIDLGIDGIDILAARITSKFQRVFQKIWTCLKEG